jgi:hypothetical protein
VFLFINNELSFVDVVKSTLIPDTGLVRSHTKTIDEKKNKNNNDFSMKDRASGLAKFIFTTITVKP